MRPDCTATETGTVGPLEGGGPLVILDNGNEMRELPTKHPLGPVTEVAYFRRIAAGESHCTGDMVRGLYGETADGTSIMLFPGQSQPVAMPFSAIFVEKYQDNGTGTATATASLGGTILDVEFPKMSMVVNSDCTATLTWSASYGPLASQAFTGTNKYIVLDHGDELIGMEIQDSSGLPITLSNAKRISRRQLLPTDR